MMQRVTAFSNLSSTERGLLLRSVVLVAAVRVGLWLSPYEQVRRSLATWVRRGGAGDAAEHDPSHAERDAAATIVWSVRKASIVVPRASCLTQALAASALLDRKRLVHQLHIGVARGDGSALEAHAWIERNGRVILGDLPDLQRFTVLPPLRDAEA